MQLFNEDAIYWAKFRKHQEIVDILTNATKKKKTGQADSNKNDNESLIAKNRQQEAEIEKLKAGNDKLKQELAKYKGTDQKDKQMKDLQLGHNFRILDEKEIAGLEHIEEIGFGGGGKVIKVAMKKFYALKQMLIKNADIKSLQNFIGEYEIMSLLKHPNVLDAIGIFMSNKNIPPSILLEYCPMNLSKYIENLFNFKRRTCENNLPNC